MTTRFDRPGQVAQNVFWTPALDSSRRVDQDPYIDIQFGVRMREIWLLEDLHVEHAVKPDLGGGLTGLPCQMRVRSCISTWNLYRLRLLLGQDLPTLYL
jgi:hypothetical protein